MARPTTIATKILRALPLIVFVALLIGMIFVLHGCTATRDVGVVVPVEPAPGETLAPLERLKKKAP